MTTIYCNNNICAPNVIYNSSIVFGVFDGLHQGHKYIFDKALKYSKENNTKCGIVTFDIDPDEIFTDNFSKLMNNDDRLKALGSLDADFVVALNFLEIKDLKAIDFLNIFFKKNKPDSIHVGKNFHFGKNGEGNFDLLYKWGYDNNVRTFEYDLLKIDGHIISSTWIRENS